MLNFLQIAIVQYTANPIFESNFFGRKNCILTKYSMKDTLKMFGTIIH